MAASQDYPLPITLPKWKIGASNSYLKYIYAIAGNI
jgi:hypothetical protein